MHDDARLDAPSPITLADVFGEEAFRTEGIFGWWQVAQLGSANIARLLDIARSEAAKRLHQGEGAAEMRRLRPALDFLDRCESDDLRPLFPRLRTECFRLGDEVMAFLGDTPGALATGWVPGKVTAIEKSHKLEWVSERPTSGYYWRVTLTADREVLPQSRTLAFSTSEPRVMHAWELEWLRRSRDELFLCSFSINATRTWAPIWWLERGFSGGAEPGRYRDWLIP